MYVEKAPDEVRPVITPKKFQDAHLNVGERLELQASIDGYPTPDVEWFKDSIPLVMTKRISISNVKSLHKLSIKAALIEDAGEYKLVAKNKVASASYSADLTVGPEPAPPEFTTKLHDQEVSDMDQVTFEVSVKNCDKLSWFLDDLPISDDEDYEFNQTGENYSYRIKSVNPEDSGKYACKAVNKHGSTSSSCQLTVNEIEQEVKDDVDGKKDGEPVIQSDVPETPIQTIEGERFEVTFNISGEPTPEVFFYKDDDPLEDSDRVQINNVDGRYTFIIESISAEDAGAYVVEVEGTSGLVEREFQIKVSRKWLDIHHQ